MMKFKLKYFMITLLIFVVEVLIATVFKNLFFIRAYLGDVLVVMLIYTFILSFFNIQNRIKLLVGIFIFSVFIEVLQYFKTADLLGFKEGSIPHIVLGNSFSWIDIICYGIGCVLVFILNKFTKNQAIDFKI